jgi:uncharacterized protein YbjT (DUF2867 family)
MNLIIGANGRIGRLVVEAITQSGHQPRVFVRDTTMARERFGESIEIANGNLNEQASIERALDGITGIFLCSPVNPDQVQQHNAVVDAAMKTRMRPAVVKLSGLATFPESYVDSGRWHAETERYLAGSGLPFACLHPYFFMQNFLSQLPSVLRSGTLRSGVARAAIATIDTRDIAAVVTQLLLNPSLIRGQTLPLTSGEATTYPEIAKILSNVFARDVAFKAQTPAEVEQSLRKAGQPEWRIQLLLQFNRAFSEGLGAQIHPGVQDILGRTPISLAEFFTSVDAAGT